MVKKALMLLLVLLMLVINIFSGDMKVVEKSFAKTKAVTVRTICGDLELKESADGQVHVLLQYSFDDDSFKPTMEMNADVLDLTEEFERSTSSGQAKWTVSIPSGLEVKFVSASGSCRVADLAVNLEVKNASGNIDISGLTGKVMVKTASGDLDGSKIKGEVTLSAASGSIKLSDVEGTVSVKAASADFWGSDLSGHINVSVASGEIVIKNSKGVITAKAASGDVSAKQVTLSGSSEIKSASGDVLLSLSGPLMGNLTMKSASGNVNLIFAGQPIDAEFTCAVQKGRGRIVAPFSFSSEKEIEKNGNIYIEKESKQGKSAFMVVMSSASGDVTIEK